MTDQQAARPSALADSATPEFWFKNAFRPEDFIIGPWQSLSEAAVEAQKVWGEAFAGELKVLNSAQERLSRECTEILGCVKVQDLPAAWARFSTSYLDIFATHVMAASNVAEKLQRCYAQIGSPSNGDGAATPQS